MLLFLRVQMPHNCLFIQVRESCSITTSFPELSLFINVVHLHCCFLWHFLNLFFLSDFCLEHSNVLPKTRLIKKVTDGACLPWRHPFLLLTSRWMLCFLQKDNSPHYKGNQLPKEGRSPWLIWGSVCNLSQIPGTSKGTTHLEYGMLRKLLKSQSEGTLFPELCFPGFLFIPLEFTKVPRHLGKKRKSLWINIE